MTKKIGFNLLDDSPIANGQDSLEFYHDKVAPAIKEILENKTCVHTIGLFGKWGSGKSTIIERIKGNFKYPVFVFDAWKYQEDSLRRIFLLELVDFLSTLEQQKKVKLKEPEFEKIKQNIESVLYNDTEKTTSVEVKGKSSWREIIWGPIILIIILISVVLAEKYLHLDQTYARIVDYIAGSSVLLIILARIFLPIFVSFLSEISNRITKNILPLATIRDTVEREERLNSPEQFEKAFKEIINCVESDGVIIVFDNIDRLQGDTAIKILSTIKTFLDPKDIKGLTFIVPCDSDAINNQIRGFYKDTDPDFNPSEYLRKLFNVIIWLPEFIEADLQDFIESSIQKTGEIKELLRPEDVAFVIGSAFSKNPREIKQFINNLISALVLASKTNVWDIIKSNVPYLAKVLVLKQQFPRAYQALKESWFDPENIPQDDEEDKSLHNFMLNTSRITTENAEPFIYFKKPEISERLANSTGLTIALVENDKETVEKIIKGETNKNEVVKFVELLLKKYRSQKELLKNIFITHLEVFEKLKVNPARKSYFEILARRLDSDLWPFFTELPTDLIFGNILAKKDLDRKFLRPIIERYALALGSKESNQPGRPDLTRDILENLKNNPNLIDEDIKKQIPQSIDSNFATRADIILLFDGLQEQGDFVTPQAFEKFIININSQTFLKDAGVIFQYKEFIIKHNKLGLILQKITELIQRETSESTVFRQEKETLTLESCKIFAEFKTEFVNVDEGTKAQLADQFINGFNSMQGWDNRACFINSLRYLSFSITDSQNNVVHSLIDTFFQQAGATKIEEILSYWEEDEATQFINDFSTTFVQRCLQDEAVRNMIYQKSDKAKQSEIITNLINSDGVNYLNFIKSLDNNLPDRQLVFGILLNKVPSLSLNDQSLIYDYLGEKVVKTDPLDLKNQISEKIKILLESEDPISQEVGFKLMSSANFLSEEKKREIGKSALDWLRQPGKMLNSNHRFIIKTVAYLVPIMQETIKSDFIFTLFNMLNQERDDQTLGVISEVLCPLKPKYSKYKKDYMDLLDRIKVWPESPTKNKMKEIIACLKSVKPSKNEAAFWKEVETI